MSRQKPDKWDRQAERQFDRARKQSLTFGNFHERLCKEQAAALRRVARAEKMFERRRMIAVISDWDSQLSTATNGLRFSDIVACKLNATRLRHPRKVPRQPKRAPGEHKR